MVGNASEIGLAEDRGSGPDRRHAPTELHDGIYELSMSPVVRERSPVQLGARFSMNAVTAF
jgi:hypothetical protein